MIGDQWCVSCARVVLPVHYFFLGRTWCDECIEKIKHKIENEKRASKQAGKR